MKAELTKHPRVYGRRKIELGGTICTIELTAAALIVRLARARRHYEMPLKTAVPLLLANGETVIHRRER